MAPLTKCNVYFTNALTCVFNGVFVMLNVFSAEVVWSKARGDQTGRFEWRQV